VPPLAVQVLAPPVDQASVAACPAWIVEGLTVKELIVAALGGGAVTVTTTELGPALPPDPVQVRV
jgi:hypothetical protein